MNQRLAGKVALVTGASRGIGRATALCLATDGGDVVVNYRSHPDGARSVAKEVEALGRRALVVQADVADRAAVERLFAEAVGHFGHVDIAVANAAAEKHALVIDVVWEEALRVFEVTQFGVFHTCQFAARQMVKQHQDGQVGGKIVIISSLCQEISHKTTGVYGMAKAAVNHLAAILANELAPYRINVNVINCGWIDTPGEHAMYTDAQLQEGGKRIPWGRLGTAEEIGKAVAFLASDDASYVTGATLRVDGGFKVGM